MKKTVRTCTAAILVFAIIFSMGGMPAFASDDHNKAIRTVTDIIGGVIDGALGLLEFITPTQKYPTVEEYFASESENFYEGTESFIDSPAEGAKWSLGFGKASVVPDNLADGSKKYYTGGYFTQKIDGVYDDQGANAIAMSDGSGRGTSIFVSVDGIGVNNTDVRAIRAAAEEKLSKMGIESDINAININATHCHTVCDTQGIGIDLVGNLFLGFIGIKQRFVDNEFLEYMIDGTSDAIVEAYVNMEEGKLYYFETVGVGKDEEKGLYLDDEYNYLRNKRYDTEGYQHKFACFSFVPDDENSSGTVFTNIGAHPTSISRDTSLLSADFPHYMEEKFNENGMNFMFIQGAQAPVSVNKSAIRTESVLSEAKERVEGTPDAAEYEGTVALGYEYARLILESMENAVEVEPVLNVRMTEYAIKLDMGLLGLGAIEGYIGTTTVRDSSSKTGYSVITEAGYIEIGNDIVMLTAPGELVPQLVFGNVVSAEDSYLGIPWEYDACAELVPEGKTVLVMGLCNDALGYIVPDNDYAHFIADSLWAADGAEKIFGTYHRHYEELLATGSTAGSATVEALNGLIEDCG